MDISFFEFHEDTCDYLPFLLVSIGKSIPQPPMKRDRGLPRHAILWVTRGHGTVRFDDGSTHELSEGEGYIVRSNYPHYYEGNNFDTFWMTFELSISMLRHYGIDNYMIFHIPEFAQKEIDYLLQLCLGDSTTLSRSIAGYSFIAEILSAVSSPKRDPASIVYDYLKKRYKDPLTLAEIANHVGMDRFALCRYYKRSKGTSVMEELNRIRIEKAKRYLKYNSMSSAEIARLCGFSNPSYFSKCFREAVGCSPLKYRRSY